MMGSRTLYVPLGLPVNVTRPMIERELKFREVVSLKLNRYSIEIEHTELSQESKADMMSCIEVPIVIMS